MLASGIQAQITNVFASTNFQPLFRYRPFASRTNWNVILQSSLVMQMQRFTSVITKLALDPDVIDHMDLPRRTILLASDLDVVER